jgi:membrane protein YdbS with pleckstrin-like domain
MTRLPPAARSYWRTQVGAAGLVAVVAVLSVLGPLWGLLAALLAAATAAALPAIWWRRWSYLVGDDAIELHHGLWTVRHTLVPIRRVQHVDTQTGPLQSAFDLATVSVHTAAGQTRVPGLRRGEAEAVRRRIGELARTRDDV